LGYSKIILALLAHLAMLFSSVDHEYRSLVREDQRCAKGFWGFGVLQPVASQEMCR